MKLGVQSEKMFYTSVVKQYHWPYGSVVSEGFFSFHSPLSKTIRTVHFVFGQIIF